MGVLPILAALAEVMAASVCGPAAIAADAPSFAALLAPPEDDADTVPDGPTEPPRVDDSPRDPIDALTATALVVLTVPTAPALPAVQPADGASDSVRRAAPGPACAPRGVGAGRPGPRRQRGRLARTARAVSRASLAAAASATAASGSMRLRRLPALTSRRSAASFLATAA